MNGQVKFQTLSRLSALEQLFKRRKTTGSIADSTVRGHPLYKNLTTDVTPSIVRSAVICESMVLIKTKSISRSMDQ